MSESECSAFEYNEFTEGQRSKLLYLLDVLGEPLPELEDLMKLPEDILRALDEADENMLRALLIEIVGRWLEMKEEK